MRRNPFVAGAVGAALAVVVLVAFPGLGIGQPTGSHGGTPSDVFMNTDPGVCNGEDQVRTDPVSLIPTAVSVGEPSADLLAYFTSTSSAFGLNTELNVALQVEGGEFFASSPNWIVHPGSSKTPHSTFTVMWTFPNVPSGDYTVEATAFLAAFQGTVGSGDGANLQSCALSVFVMPAG